MASVYEDYTMDMNAKEIGWKIRMSRDDLGVTQEDLAAQVNISRSYLTNIEKGRAENVGIRHIENIAHALGVTVEYLIGLSDDPLPKVELPAHLNETNVIYELYEVKDKIRLQRLIDNYQALDSSLQDIVLNLATALHDAQIAQMYDR
jgi:transcriptional regulator with XRE-family HTH domain